MRALALTLEAIAAHSTTEGKLRAAAAYLAAQEADRLGVAARMLAGAPLPPGTPATRVGRSTVLEVVCTLAAADRGRLVGRARLLGDLGTAVGELLADRRATGPRLSLGEVAEMLGRLGRVGSTRRRRLLGELYARATPLEAKYLTKLLLGSLRTGMQAARVEQAIALAFDRPVQAVRRAHMLLGDLGATAERAAAGTLAGVTLRAFRPVRSMLAYSCADVDEVVEVIGLPAFAEPKYDGIRAQLHLVDGVVRLYSRALEEVSHLFPEVRTPPPGLTGEWILDGELVAWRAGRPLPFATLQRRLGRRQVPLTLLLDAPAAFLAFDVLRSDGADLIDAPLSRRKQALDRLPARGPVCGAPWARVATRAQVQAAFRRALRAGHEGVVFKVPDSSYTPGVRGRAWAQLKRPLATLAVVVTGAEYGRGKRAGMLSDMVFAVRDGRGGLLECGRAHSGLTDAEMRELTALFRTHTIARAGSLRRVRPSVVLEVAFDQVRRSSRYPSGYALRFPRILRRRTDLGVDEAACIEDLRRLCARRPRP